MQPKISRAGDRGLLLDELNMTARELHALARGALAHPAVLSCVPGQQSLLVLFRGEPDQDIFRDIKPDIAIEAPQQHVIKVSVASEYASDLPEFLHHARLTQPEFLARLSSLTLTARYLGFRGGFAYLDGWPAEWAMPRRPTSRPVKRGSFAMAGSTAGFYPIDTPGGWNVLGRTAANLEHAIRAGDEIRIVPIDSPITIEPVQPAPRLTIAGVEIVGPLAVVVPGEAASGRLERGLSAGGPFDDRAAVLANRLVGNGDDAPVVECALAGPRVRFTVPRWVAWCGASSDLPDATPFLAEELTIGRIRDGMRGYLAIGSNGPRVTDVALLQQAHEHVGRVRSSDRRVIRVIRGPHLAPSDAPLGASGALECEVTPQLDRVGIRLRPLQDQGQNVPADLPSCGMQFGTIQLHPDGSLVAMGPDHPMTGGYLQPLTVAWEERWKLGQLMPGEIVRFVAD